MDMSLGKVLRDSFFSKFAISVFCFSGSVQAPLTAVAQTRQPVDKSAPEVLDFAGVLREVRKNSLSLGRFSELKKSAEFNHAAVQSQSAPALQLSSNLTAQYVAPSKQTHILSVGMTLWDFGRQSAQELKSAAQMMTADSQTVEAEESLRIKVARFYVADCSAQSVLADSQEQLRNAESKLKTVRAGYLRGERPQTDVVRLTADVGKAQLVVKKAQDEFDWQMEQMSLLMSPARTSASTKRKSNLKPLPMRDRQWWSQFVVRFSAARIQSAALEKVRSGKALLEAEMETLNADAYPVISASAGFQGLGNFKPVKPDALAQLNLQYNLPFSSIREQKKQSILARLKENELALEEELKNRNDKLIQSRLKLEGLLGQIDLQKAQIDILLEYQKLVRTRYFAGRASLLELTSTEDELLANRLELTRMQSNLYLAAIDAAEALGGKELEKLF
ncbi:TolC family protein [bacterium]|nr:TolC family protein [bacterium]